MSAAQTGRRSLVLLFVGALLLRLIALAVLAPQRAAENASAWDFGHEAACLGQSLHDGQGLGDPWGHGTGASGWLTPPYPALLAVLLSIFGSFGPALALCLFVLQSLAGALCCVLVVQLGRNLDAPRAGWWGGVIFALYPPAIWNAIAVVWDTSFVALGTCACLVALTRPAALSSAGRVFALGLCWGALALLNPAPLALLPAVLLYLALSQSNWRLRLARSALLVLGILVVCAPWMLRNARLLGTPNLRPNFGVELRLGNNPDSNGHPVPMKFHPSHVPEELALYRRLGERAYAQDSQRRALEWIRAHPGDFAALTFKRGFYFWIGDPPLSDARVSAGSGARSDPKAWAKFVSFAALGILGWIGALRWKGPARERALLLGALLCFGLAYYVTHVSERYRFPIDPLLALLAAACVLPLFAARSPETRSR